MNTREFGEEQLQVMRQRILRIDDVQPIANDGKHEIDTLRTCRRLCNECVTRMARHQWADSKRAVPQTRMVSTNVTYID